MHVKNFRFNAICNITQEPQELQRYNRACRFIDKSAVTKCHQLLSKVISTAVKIAFPPVSNRYLLYLSLNLNECNAVHDHSCRNRHFESDFTYSLSIMHVTNQNLFTMKSVTIVTISEAIDINMTNQV